MDARAASGLTNCEGQEDQLGALGLVTNAVDEDIVRLSPLMYGHINMLGHYTFTLPEDILKGEMRTLNSI